MTKYIRALAAAVVFSFPAASIQATTVPYEDIDNYSNGHRDTVTSMFDRLRHKLSEKPERGNPKHGRLHTKLKPLHDILDSKLPNLHERLHNRHGDMHPRLHDKYLPIHERLENKMAWFHERMHPMLPGMHPGPGIDPTPTATPLPAAIWLFVAGLGGLGLFMGPRRKH